MGTPAYMSPEQLRYDRVDHRSDIFSAGVVFYELLTYRKPFHGDSNFSISLKIVDSDPAPVEDLEKSIPPELSSIIRRLLEKDPAAALPDDGRSAPRTGAGPFPRRTAHPRAAAGDRGGQRQIRGITAGSPAALPRPIAFKLPRLRSRSLRPPRHPKNPRTKAPIPGADPNPRWIISERWRCETRPEASSTGSTTP